MKTLTIGGLTHKQANILSDYLDSLSDDPDELSAQCQPQFNHVPIYSLLVSCADYWQDDINELLARMLCESVSSIRDYWE